MAVSPQVAASLATDLYGLDATATPLAGEVDQIFRLDTADGKRFVIKIADPIMDTAVAELYIEGLDHIAKADPGLPVETVIPTTGGARLVRHQFAGGEWRAVRLFSFLDGVPLHTVERTPAQCRALGTLLAKTDLALQGFSHPAATRELLWDIQQAYALRDRTGYIEDPVCRALAETHLDRFEAVIRPAQGGLRCQVVHNDFNANNILVDAADHDRIVGLLDFGDMIEAPLINDLAIAASYQLLDTETPLALASELIAAFHAVLPLERAELDWLADLVAMRYVMMAVGCTWRAHLRPENREYLMRNIEISWARLDRIDALPEGAAAKAFRTACGME